MRVGNIEFFVAVAMVSFTSVSMAEEGSFRLFAPEELRDSGLFTYIGPRFSLKTGRTIQFTDSPTTADLVFVTTNVGEAVFVRGETGFALDKLGTDADALMFVEWLRSQAGMAAVTGYVPPDGPPFSTPEPDDIAVGVVAAGDTVLGEAVARQHCTRCHSVASEDRTNIGSTPSFMALRAIPDWDERFSMFYQLNPHPSFIRVTGVSPDFDPMRPPSLVPIELTLEEVEAILAYAATIAPANLGAEVMSR